MMAKLLKAYQHLPYDIFLLSPADQQSLALNELTSPSSWYGPLTKPQVVVQETTDGSIAFVLFPDSTPHNPSMNEEIGDFIRNLRATGAYNLIVGLSTWGSDREEEFITAEKNTLDILLGSGDGPGYTGLYLEDNSILWVRAFTKGKAINTITIPTLPDPGEKVVWDPEVTILTKVESLDHKISLDEEMNTLLDQP